MPKPSSNFGVISKECYREISQSTVNLGLISKTKGSSGRNPFKNIKSQTNGVLAGSATHPVVMAATLAAHSDFFEINKKPMIIPACGMSVTSTYYQQAITLLHHRITQLEDAYQHYINRLKSTKSSKYTRSYLNNVNKAVQIQQYLAGAVLLRRQYILLQPNSNHRLALTPAAIKKCMAACTDFAKLYHTDHLGDEARHLQLFTAANSGDIASLKLLLADLATNINKPDADNNTALLVAASADQLAAVKLLVKHGATVSIDTPAEYSPLTVSVMSGFDDIAHYLKQYAVVSSKKITKKLPQGPSSKNRALKDVEYIFHCLLALDYPTTNEKDRTIYAPKLRENGEPCQLSIVKNSKDFFLADCPNGRRYNLSLALKHANFNYFMLDEGPHAQAIIHRCDAILTDRLLGGTVKNISVHRHVEQGGMIFYFLEEQAIRDYTGDLYYQKMNALLRGKPNEIPVQEVNNIFIRCMLAMSGANKNIDTRLTHKPPKLVRRDEELPIAMRAKMASTNRTINRAGFVSCSQGVGIFRGHRNTLTITDHHYLPIAGIAIDPHENETLLPASTIVVTKHTSNTIDSEHYFEVKIVTGVATEYAQEYYLELALHSACIILANPFADLVDSRFGISRHNHALAHHVRVCMLVEPSINYFKQHATSEEFRKFCDHLTPDELIIIKIMMIFSKTGRESEVSATSDLETYMKYQRASVKHFTNFLQRKMHCDDKQIAFYAEILMYMGNPTFAAKATGTPHEIQHKIFVNHIITLAHKLDLPRVYSAEQYSRSMTPYNGTILDGVIRPSIEQKVSLQIIESQAMLMLKHTGDRLAFSKHEITAVEYSEHLFRSCNTDADYCWQCCEIACIQIEDKYKDNLINIFMLNDAMVSNQQKTIIHTILHFKPNDYDKFEQKFGTTVLSALLNLAHDCRGVLQICAPYMPIDQLDTLYQFRQTLEQKHYSEALKLSDCLLSSDCIVAALRSTFEYFDITIFISLLAKFDDEACTLAISKNTLQRAIKKSCSSLMIEMMVSAGIKPNASDLLCALEHGLDVVIISYLFDNLTEQEINAEILIEACSETSPPWLAGLVNDRLDYRPSIQGIILENADEITSILFAKSIKYNPAKSQDLINGFYHIIMARRGLSLSDFLKSHCDTDDVRRLLSKGMICSAADLDCAYDISTNSETKQLLIESVDMSSLPPSTVLNIINEQPSEHHETILCHLVERGINVNYPINPSLLCMAIEKRYSLDMIQLLLNNGAMVSNDVMLMALRQPEPFVLLEVLLVHITSANISAQLVIAVISAYPIDDAERVLDIILKKGYVLNSDSERDLLAVAILLLQPINMIELFINHGAQVKPKHLLACYHANAECQVRLLILKHTDLARISPRFAIQIFTHKNSYYADCVNTINAMIENGYDINKTDQNNHNLMRHILLKPFNNDTLVMRKIIENGYQVTSNDFISSLNYRYCHDETLKLMLKSIEPDRIDVEIFAKAINGLPPFSRNDLLYALHQSGLDFNIQGADHRSLLYHALELKLPLSAIKQMIYFGAILSYEEYSLFAEDLPKKLSQDTWEALPPPLRLAYINLAEAVSVLTRSPIPEIVSDLVNYHSWADEGAALLRELLVVSGGQKHSQVDSTKVLQLLLDKLPASFLEQPLDAAGNTAFTLANENGLTVVSDYLISVGKSIKHAMHEEGRLCRISLN
ncbi:MAG: SidE phosphodiesterase domain-containing protein [Coxiellaceae bacterium]|nr:SidE phosphodiesterase domain-containing protein [Coxiellaceae bacterium]